MSSILTPTRWAAIANRTGTLIGRTVKAGGNGRDREEHAWPSAHAPGADQVGRMAGTRSRLVRAVAITVALPGLIVGCGADLEQSPRSEKIVFDGDRYSIFTMNPDGTEVTRIAEGTCPSFAPDGSKIVVGGYSISVMDPDGGNVTKLARGGDPALSPNGSDVTKLAHGGYGCPTFSADGTRIAFTRGRVVYVMNADGAALKQLIVNPDPSGPFPGNVIPDIVIPGIGAPDIVIPGASIPVPSGGFPVEDPDGVASTDRPAFSPDGSKILFARPSGIIWVMASDGTGARPLLPDEPYVNSTPVFTPDGAGIVFASNRAWNGRGGIYVMDVDGQNIRLLTDDATNPSFSPDGTKIIYHRRTRDPASTQGAMFSEMWVMNRDGSNPHRLIDPKQSVQHADWSSWGRRTGS
ncbi:hypothetical protein OHB12_17405 [Nocardia sp. NBC_01730]|uniref:hypothetical protein n=1 Tax=Nocardia sp. NBC_01730 TaxID=2975998 RepID=UPI002E14BBFF|nr:hypothetical protein OHB12_17405 [Nocardia sp. NBC_01730]